MNKKTPKLSIITVCFNNKNGLLKTMQSVVRQTFTDYEYIVIDGGSTDGTIELIKNEELKIKNFRWVSEKDNGIYDAMNKGIQMACGEYCYFLNSDDYIATSNTLEKIFARLKPETDIIYGNLAILKNNKLYNVAKFSKKITPYSFYRHKVAIHHQASFIRRDLFEKYGLYSNKAKLISDWIFFFETVLLHKVKIQYINRVFTLFLSGGESSTGINEKHIKDNFIQTHFSEKQIEICESKEKLHNTLKISKIEKVFGKIYLLHSLLKEEIKNEN